MSGNAATAQISFPKDGYYLFYEGQNTGPFTMEEVLQKFDGGAIPRTTPLWFPGLANWITVADLPDLDRREPAAKEIALPQKDRPDDIIVQLKGNPLSLKPQSVKALVTFEDLRRTDLVYDEVAKIWVRSDQHSVVRVFYSMPASPSPLPFVAIEPKIEPVTEPKAAAAPIPAKAAKTAAPTGQSWAKYIWILIAIAALALVAFSVWTFFPAFRGLLSLTRSPATIQSAGFISYSDDEPFTVETN